MTPDPMTLSTGQTVEFPVDLEATMLGAVYSAPRAPVDALLPGGVQPIRATPGGDAAVTFLSVEYHDIGVNGIDPYDEFGVIVPATHGATTVPYLSPLTRATSGYVWYLPVTTEPARALGVDVWGFPKVVADITHEDEGSQRRTTVSIDGERFVTMLVDRPPSIHRQDDGYSYSVRDGALLYTPADIDAEIGGWPFTDAVAVTLGEHDRAEVLRDLNLGLDGRALARIALDGTVRFHPGEPLAANESRDLDGAALD